MESNKGFFSWLILCSSQLPWFFSCLASRSRGYIYQKLVFFGAIPTWDWCYTPILWRDHVEETNHSYEEFGSFQQLLWYFGRHKSLQTPKQFFNQFISFGPYVHQKFPKRTWSIQAPLATKIGDFRSHAVCDGADIARTFGHWLEWQCCRSQWKEDEGQGSWKYTNPPTQRSNIIFSPTNGKRTDISQLPLFWDIFVVRWVVVVFLLFDIFVWMDDIGDGILGLGCRRIYVIESSEIGGDGPRFSTSLFGDFNFPPPRLSSCCYLILWRFFSTTHGPWEL